MEFVATKDQEKVRKSARALYDSGMCLVGDWVRRIPCLTMKKWGVWEKTSGFMEWWIEMFPEHAGITVTDLRALEFEAARALMKAVTEGDLHATKVVIGMVSTAKEAQGIGDRSMDDWFSPPDTNGWEKEWN